MRRATLRVILLLGAVTAVASILPQDSAEHGQDFVLRMNQCRLSLQDKPENRNPDLTRDHWIPVTFPDQRREPGIVWYACQFEMPEHPQSLMVVLQKVRHADETFVNGIPIGNTGDVNLSGIRMVREVRAYPLPVSFLLSGTNTLTVRLRAAGRDGRFGIAPEIRDGRNIASLIRDSSRRDYEDVVFGAVFLFVACYFYYVWWQFRSQRENLFFAICCTGLALYLGIRSIPMLLGTPNPIAMRFEYAALFLNPNTFMRFLFPFLGRKTPRAVFVYDAYVIACVLGLFLLDDPEEWRVILRYFQYSVFPILIVAAVIVSQAIANRNREALYLTLGFVLFFLTIVNDLLGAMGVWRSPSFISYGFAAFLFSIALILANRYVQLYREQEEKNELLRDLDRRKTDFLSNISHEIKTPLAEVMMYAESLEDGTLQTEEELEDAHAEIKKSAARLQRVVSDTVLLNLLETNLYSPEIGSSNLAEAVENAVHLLSDETRRQEIRIHSDIPANLFVKSDTDLLGRILENLIENGILYNRKGGVLALAAQTNDQTIEITIKDEGNGVPENVRRHLFQKFVRGDSSITYAVPGTGTGLALAALAASCMSGSVQLLNTGVAGTVFSIRLDAGAANV
ncbi:MAG: sensor histidine kinase [Spirochaetia bacterium]|nr:sensor histidine kinase [Spirochaetia bacterium]